MKFHTLILCLVLGISWCDAASSKPKDPGAGDTTITIGNKKIQVAEGVLDGITTHDDPLHKMGSILNNVYKSHMGQGPTGISAFVNNIGRKIIHDDGTVSIDAVAFGVGSELQELLDELEPLGFEVAATYKHVASGKLPVSSLGEICECSSLVRAMPALAFTEAGSVTSEGVRAMGADTVLQGGINGTGVTVGVISDSFNSFGGAEVDIATGDLPPADRIKVLLDDFGIDEGRAMMQIVHDVAPGANLAFHSGFGGQAQFALGIFRLASEADCEIVVDDLTYFAEPAFQDGIISQAVDEVRDKYGVAYFSSAGNRGRQAYEHKFVPGIEAFFLGANYTFHDFAYGSVPFQPQLFQAIYLPNQPDVTLTFQWDEPFASASPGSGSSSDMDIFLFDSTGTTLLAVGLDINVGGDPLEFLFIDVTSILLGAGRGGDPGFTFQLAIGLFEGAPPGLMKIVVDPDPGRFLDYPTNSGTSYGHHIASGAAGVAAAFAGSTPAFGVDPPLVEPFSSAGGTPILIDTNGDRLDGPEIRRQPKFTGPDGISNTFFGIDNRFFGTSAAAPHVAGVAALMLEADPKVGPRRVIGVLERTASDMSDPEIPGPDIRFDFRTGYGFVNASAAVEEVLALKNRRKRNLRSALRVAN